VYVEQRGVLLVLVLVLVQVLILVLIDAETNANPSFNLRLALRVFSMAWPKFETLLRAERCATLALNNCCAQSGARL